MQEFIVSTLEDENDGDFSDGDLSLREAIAIAESGDTITFNSNLSDGTIDLNLGELAIDKSLIIRGLGADQLTIGAIGVSRVFNIDDGNPDREIDVTLDGLTITNGFLDGRSGVIDQGSSFDPRGSGILTTENLDLLNSSVLENETDGDGGGIYSFGGRLRIDNSIIENNRAEGARSRLTTTIGGGIATIDTTVEITNSSITGNFAGLDSGGGLDFRNSQVTITDSSIANNTSYGAGGINSINSTVDISRTVITGNETGRSRGSGAINSDADSILNIDRSFIDSNFDFEISSLFRAFASGISARGTTTISNSTISNNTAEILDAAYGIRNTGDLSIVNSTFAGNSDGGINNDGGTVNIANTTIADRLIGADSTNLTSTIVVDDSQGLEAAIDESNNLIGNSEDLGLGELQDNGGFAPTIALSENSPAINAGSNLGSLATDQRGEGFDRTIGAGTDIGAFELQTVVDSGGGGMIPDELVVSTLADENDGDFSEGNLSLREAIAIANEQEGEDTITFDSSLSGGTITLIRDQSTGRPTLANAPLSITDSVTISGLGKDNITIDGDNGANGIFLLGSDGQQINVTIEDLTLANGAQSAFFFPGLSAPGGTFDVGANTNFTLQNSSITSSSASIGGAINNNGTVSIINSTIQDSASGSDGPTSNPIGRNGVVVNNGEMDIISSDISNNSTGGLTNLGILRVTDSTIANNNFNTFNSNTFGGGIDNRSVLTVSNSTIAGNTATLGGGIFSSQDAQTTVNNSTITDNSAAEGGNGVYNQQGSNEGTFIIASTIIAGNADNLDLGGDAFFDSQGNNLIGNAEGVNSSFEQSNNDLVGTSDNPIDPLLGELQNNGGATPTIALLENSPAIDAGSNLGNLTTDQRGGGFDRTVGNGTDIGAFELQTVVTPNLNEIIGTAGGDVLEGTESGDRIEGLDGNDTIRGLGGDDTVEGNNGNDSIEGGAGNDVLNGSDGFDSLFGGHGNDTLDAGIGNDSLDGGAGNDLLFGLGDRDTLLGGDGEDTLEGGAGVDFLDGGANNDQLFGGLDNDSLRGNDGDDLLNGGAGIDSLEGGHGNDTLLGGDGNDSLFGGNGNDFIDGGLGNDSLRGDDGNDTFVLTSGNGTDFIVDFDRGHNLLGLFSGIHFADLSFSGNDIILGDETLATLNGFNTTNLGENNFISI